MFAAQSLDFCADLLEQERRGLRDDVHAFDIFGTYFYLLNNSPTLPGGRKNPLADVRVRRALDEVIDKRALVDKVTRLDQRVADTFIPPGTIPGYHSPPGLKCMSDAATPAERDRILADARRQLTEAGYPGGRGFPELTILYNPEGGHRLVSEFPRNTWGRELHIPAQIQSLEFKVLLDRRSDGDYMVARSGWTGDYSDPTTFLNLFRTGNGDNESKFSSPQVDRWLDAADRTIDPAARMKLLEKAEARCMDERVPFIPLYHYKAVHLFDPKRITNLPMHPRNMQLLYLVRVKK
jgi:oligopeptide transport system substrate-binding protein